MIIERYKNESEGPTTYLQDSEEDCPNWSIVPVWGKREIRKKERKKMMLIIE